MVLRLIVCSCVIRWYYWNLKILVLCSNITLKSGHQGLNGYQKNKSFKSFDNQGNFYPLRTFFLQNMAHFESQNLKFKFELIICPCLSVQYSGILWQARGSLCEYYCPILYSFAYRDQKLCLPNCYDTPRSIFHRAVRQRGPHNAGP